MKALKILILCSISFFISKNIFAVKKKTLKEKEDELIILFIREFDLKRVNFLAPLSLPKKFSLKSNNRQRYPWEVYAELKKQKFLNAFLAYTQYDGKLNKKLAQALINDSIYSHFYDDTVYSLSLEEIILLLKIENSSTSSSVHLHKRWALIHKDLAKKGYLRAYKFYNNFVDLDPNCGLLIAVKNTFLPTYIQSHNELYSFADRNLKQMRELDPYPNIKITINWQ